MKLLLVSDLHYGLKQYDWVASVAHDFDLVIVAGDQLDIASHLDGSVQINIFAAWRRPRKSSSLPAITISIAAMRLARKWPHG